MTSNIMHDTRRNADGTIGHEYRYGLHILHLITGDDMPAVFAGCFTDTTGALVDLSASLSPTDGETVRFRTSLWGSQCSLSEVSAAVSEAQAARALFASVLAAAGVPVDLDSVVA